MLTFIDDDIGLTALEAPSRWNRQALVSSMSEPEDILVIFNFFHTQKSDHCPILSVRQLVCFYFLWDFLKLDSTPRAHHNDNVILW